MLMKSVGIYINAFSILLLDITSAKVKIYNDVCNAGIKLGTSEHAAKLSFRYKPNITPRVCNITIETSEGKQPAGAYYHIAYTFLDNDVGNNFKCSSKIYFDNGYYVGDFCGSNVYPNQKTVTRANKLFLTVVGDDAYEFVFDVLLLSYHNGSCEKFETLCQSLLGDNDIGSGCIEYSLVCNRVYKFCDATGSQCSDLQSPTGSNNTIVAAIVVTILGVVLLGIICFLCYKKNCFGLLKRNEPEEDVRTRALHIFSVQYANRGVDGNDNAAATDDEGDPIDFSTFDPPPAYGSWEHLDTIGVSRTDGDGEESGDVLPKYEEVMTNFDNYTVVTQI